MNKQTDKIVRLLDKVTQHLLKYCQYDTCMCYKIMDNLPLDLIMLP